MSVVAVRWAAIMFYRKITQKKVVIIVIIIIIAIIIIIIIAVIVIIIIAVTTSLSMGIRGTPVTRSSPSLSYKRILPFETYTVPPDVVFINFLSAPQGFNIQVPYWAGSNPKRCDCTCSHQASSTI